MRKVLFLALAIAAAASAQPRDVYKVDFNIRDSGDAGGKTGRKYSLLVYSGNKGVFKIGNRVPVITGGTSGANANTQFTYVDVGVNIDCSVQEASGRMGLRGDIDLSTAILPDKAQQPAPAPTISQIRLAIETSIPPGKPTVVASFDDPVTSRKFELEAVVTKVN